MEEFVSVYQSEFDHEFNDFHDPKTLFIFPITNGGCIILRENGTWEFDAAPFAD